MLKKCDGSTCTPTISSMSGFSPSRTSAIKIGKHQHRATTTTAIASKPNGCDFYVTSQFLTAKSVGQQVSELRPRPIYDVFLGGSCGNTVWRRDLVIPYLEKRAISYYDPQRSVWNEHMINEESIAKENSNLFLFVLDPATEQAHPEDLPDRQRSCDLLDDILTMHDVPVLQSIQDALRYIDEIIIGEKSWSEAMSNPFQRLPYMLLRGRRTCRKSISHVRNALRSVKNGVTKLKHQLKLIRSEAEKGSNFDFPGKSYILSTTLSRFAFDVFVALFSAIYYCYKINAAARRRAKLVNAAAVSLPIPGHAVVPCNIVAQQIPLSYCYQSKNRNMHTAGTSLPSRLLKKRSYDGNSGNVANPLRWMNANGYDIFLGCSSRNRIDLAWINHRAAPQLHRKGLSFCSELMVERHRRLNTLHVTRHILYHIPSCETMLSGMVEVAYFLGDSTMELTICVPKHAKMLVCSQNDDDELKKYIERRNESYRMAFCYLRDMAERKHCEIFSDLDDALQIEFTSLAAECKAVNIGQGFPDTHMPGFVAKMLKMLPTIQNELIGISTTNALVKLYSRTLGIDVDALQNILVTVGAYLSLSYSFMGWLNDGDEVIVLDPAFDCYVPQILMTGGVPIPVVLDLPSEPKSSKDYTLNVKAIEEKISNRTKMIVLNNPHNPTGKLFTQEELEKIADIVVRHIVIISSLPDIYKRTITIGSAGKAFSITGWKLGWSIAPAELLEPLKRILQNCVFTCPTPIQKGITSELIYRRDRMASILRSAGMKPIIPDSDGPFKVVDGSNDPLDFRFVRWMCREKNLAMIPNSAFIVVQISKAMIILFVFASSRRDALLIL
ncbi:Kynurenine--oxoglutarate transaminase 3 [Dirofilaria immitis]|nr:Kynurenine--oxoglutarate transaminase 3 [Dirofilaria immitis]